MTHKLSASGGCSNRACALGSSITGFSVWLCPSPALGGFVPEINLPLAKPALWDPKEITSLHPFLDFPCHSCCPEHISPAHLFRCTMRSFLNSHLHALKWSITLSAGSFLCYFWFKEKRIKWFLQREGEQIKEWMNRSMNKTFAKEQKYACYLASWSAIIFIPCRGYSVSLFLGFNLNLTDVALALKAEPQSANLFHLPCSTRIARERIVQLPTSFFLWCRGEGKGFATKNVYGLYLCKVICINFFSVSGGVYCWHWSRTDPVRNIF